MCNEKRESHSLMVERLGHGLEQVVAVDSNFLRTSSSGSIVEREMHKNTILGEDGGNG